MIVYFTNYYFFVSLRFQVQKCKWSQFYEARCTRTCYTILKDITLIAHEDSRSRMLYLERNGIYNTQPVMK